ncbi:hypothetical protein C9374_012296 [Naegleria lovaniensis]|uniref:DUF4116 domain-containing protein n=1 Tax=Naegleria lovaniensis TaxID=51637 RepID=A0AA88G851_NAELO|nr:uncharacterized protein C9374_012296 [Naegleria lovaniensis]KAG2373307.1 hypothetical protein C9374_012296 [Naegleria lovaniensis]
MKRKHFQFFDDEISEKRIYYCPTPSMTNDSSDIYILASNKEDAVKIILLDFHDGTTMMDPLNSERIFHNNNDRMDHQLHQRLKMKFENQSKGYCKWLLAKEKWMKQCKDWDSNQMNIEFMMDRECFMMKCIYNFSLPVPWLIQQVNVSELCQNNQDMIGRVEFWRPFKHDILRFIRNDRFQILKYIPKEILLEWKEELTSMVFKPKYGFIFDFDIDDFEEAKKLLAKRRCGFFQLSKRLQDNEDIIKHAIHYNPVNNIQYVFERMKHDRTFLMNVIRSKPNAFYPIASQLLAHDKEFIFQLLTVSATSIYGTFEERMIQTYVPEIFNFFPKTFQNGLSKHIKRQIFQQFFLKDARWSIVDLDLLKFVVQMLDTLPNVYYQAHKNYQRRLSVKGWFAISLLTHCEKHQILSSSHDQEFVKIIESVMTRMYMDYDPDEFEECISNRVDLPVIMRFAPAYVRKDRNFVLTALKAQGTCVKSIDETFIHDKEVVMAALASEHQCSLYDIPTHFFDDKDCMLTAMEHFNVKHPLLVDAFKRFVERNEKEVIMAGIKKDGRCLQYLSNNCHNDRSLILAAVTHSHDGTALSFVSKELKQDANFILEFVKANPKIAVSRCISNSDIDIILSSEIIIYEYVKRCGIITDKVMNQVFKHCAQDSQVISVKEAIKVLKDLMNQRLEFEYFGCHIPESRLLNEPIRLLSVEEETRAIDLSGAGFCPKEQRYNKWKEFLFDNASWEIFFIDKRYKR